MFTGIANKHDFFIATAGALLGLYFLLFFILMARYSEDRAVLIANGADKRVYVLLLPLILAAVLAPAPWNVWALGVGLVVLIVLDRAQHAKLARAGASRAFLSRLTAVSSIALLAGVSFGVSMLAATH